MLIYKNIFDNTMTTFKEFPIEDYYAVNSHEAIVADGITRDPIGISDFSKASKDEFLDKYPRPSGASMAAKAICDTFLKSSGTLTERLKSCNLSVRKLNDKYISSCDYLENDYYGAVSACISITDNILKYAYICDCGVIVYDKDGNIKFQTEDDKMLYSDPYIHKIGTPWHLAHTRVNVRKNYRNNPNMIIDGKCASYGALTGEESAHFFIRSGEIVLDSGDYVLVYSDGLSNFLHDDIFIKNIINFNKDKFEDYINKQASTDYEKYGKEKTIVLFKYL